MYSTDLRDQMFSAALPLKPLFAWCGSACTITVAVPPAPAIAGLAIDAVRVQLTLPGGAVTTVDATAIENTPLWCATFPATDFATSGFVAKGLAVLLGGKDETSADRVWIAAKGDLTVREGDAAPSPTGSYILIKMRSAAPATPIAGDAYISGSTLHIYQDGAWISIGGGGGSDPEKLNGPAAYPAWVPQHAYHASEVVFHNGSLWESFTDNNTSEPGDDSGNWFETTIADLKQDALSEEQLANIEAVPWKAPLASPAFTGTPIAPTAAPGTNTTQVATTAFVVGSLPYALVTPGEWEFSGLPEGVSVVSLVWDDYVWRLTLSNGSVYEASSADEEETEAYFYGDDSVIVATKTGLHLLDRAVNAVSVTGATTLTLPALEHAGRLRDFLVRLEISGSTVPTITFAAPAGETITYETDGDEFPVPDESGTWLYAFTETDTSTFAVALKKVNVVAQGGGT